MCMLFHPSWQLNPKMPNKRDFARSRLAVPEEAFLVYVQLGAGRINDIENILEKVLEALYAHSHVHVVLGESMLGPELLSLTNGFEFYEIILTQCMAGLLTLQFKQADTIHSKR